MFVFRRLIVSELIVISLFFWSHLFVSLCVAQSPPAQPSIDRANIQSDTAALTALAGVVEASGGAALWQQLQSAQEEFTVSDANGANQQVEMTLDDWSQAFTRYVRTFRGSDKPLEVHDGAQTFTVRGLNGQDIVIPELDQASVLAVHLPAAAAGVVLASSAYVVKTQAHCPLRTTCIEIFRKIGNSCAVLPDQRWQINAATGLPIAIEIGTSSTLPSSISSGWRTVRFASYGNQSGMIIPKLEQLGTGRSAKTFALVNFLSNPGFNPAQLSGGAQ